LVFYPRLAKWALAGGSSNEKIAFVMQDGLFEFKIMPFGLYNTPAIVRGSWIWFWLGYSGTSAWCI